MAQQDSSQLQALTAAEPQATQPSLWKRWFGPGNAAAGPCEDAENGQSTQRLEREPGSAGDDSRPDIIRRVSRKVVPGLPRAQTFKRQQAEARTNLEPVQPTPAEKRALSVDRRLHSATTRNSHSSNPRSSAPEFTGNDVFSSTVSAPSMAGSAMEEKMLDSIGEITIPNSGSIGLPEHDTASFDDSASMTTSQYDTLIHEELERIWILNLSMHFRDKSKREKFFVTFREKETHWRRVTISLDYRGAPDNSLEMDLLYTKFQRDKNAKIYEAIRESLVDIQFYDTVTNLKLQTTDGRLHVHVVEDVNEIIHYPTTHMIQHLRCRHVREKDIHFEAHLSGFVYKVKVDGETLIKKEVPGPDTVDEFLYEINALSQLSSSRDVIPFYGVIVDDYGEHVKGLLISYAEQGALIDVIYDHDHGLPWNRREKWACQIVQGLADIHEAGFVQGDFTLSNIVVDQHDDAKIIDINRRGCPVGWEPPEATPLIECNQRISMYIGVKSDLYQLGMVLWALAEQEDEPEAQGRPLALSDDLNVPDWYRTVVRICLAENPRNRLQAIDLLRLFPPRPRLEDEFDHADQLSISVDDGYAVQEFVVNEYHTDEGSIRKTVQAPSQWNKSRTSGHTYVNSPTSLSCRPYYYPARGRSPPSPLPDKPHWNYQGLPWTGDRDHSYARTHSSSGSEFAPDVVVPENGLRDLLPQMEDQNHKEEPKTVEGPSLGLLVAEDNFATTLGSVNGDTSAGQHSREELHSASLLETVSELTKQHKEKSHGDLSMQRQQESTVTESRPLDIGHLDPEDTASRAIKASENGVRGSDFIRSFPTPSSSNNIQSNSLFQEAGTTEPEALGTITHIALVPSAAKVQNQTSADTTLDTHQGGICDDRDQAREKDRVDSAIELNSPVADLGRQQRRIAGPSTVLTVTPISQYPDELLGLGSGHEDAKMQGQTTMREGSPAAISDDDLGET